MAFRDECAVFGIWGDREAARMSYLGLYAQQHRGQECTGIVSLHQSEHLQHKGIGLVGEVFKEADLERLVGSASIGHNRYSTTGDNLLANAQPLTVILHTGPIALAHNGNIVNAKVLREELIAEGAIFQGTSDTEIILHLMAKNKNPNLIESIRKAMSVVEGAYSLVVLTKDKLIAVRDPYGFRPLVLGHRALEEGGHSVAIASETCAFDLIGARYIREIKPGEIYWIDKDGEHSETFQEPKPKLAHCVFEHVYFSRPDSVVFGESVYESRKKMGAQLSKEHPVQADLVIPVPDSGVPAALGYSHESGIPFEMGIIRNHYIGRTFIQPSPSIRSFGVKIKLNPQSRILEGKKIIVVDDSMVRGTTSQKIIRLVRQAGAKEVHFRVASPPTTGGCYYGVDTPRRNQLIAATHQVNDIQEFIGADSLGYLSVEGMLRAVSESKGSSYCAACFTGKYPTPLFGQDKL